MRARAIYDLAIANVLKVCLEENPHKRAQLAELLRDTEDASGSGDLAPSAGCLIVLLIPSHPRTAEQRMRVDVDAGQW